MMCIVKRSFLIVFFLIVSASAALADQIDGNWCSPDGASLSIEGSRMVTPGGQTIIGRYDRHNVDYAIPEGEEDAGGRLSAHQLNDEHISVSVTPRGGGKASPKEIWTRCDVTS